MKKFLFTIILLSQFLNAQIITLNHKFYETKFNLTLKQPIYTYYTLTKQESSNNKYIQTSFKPDKLLLTTLQGSARDYKNSSFDRGHLSPNDDFRFDSIAQLESMIYTNVAPQNHQMNIGIWKSLENHCRKISKYYDIEIWTGCIYTNSKQYVGKLLVPTHFWKLVKYNGHYEAYKIPNQTLIKTAKYEDYQIDKTELLNLIN